MKIKIFLYILFISSSTFSNDISKFEIEGMSIGDSLLDYFSEKEIMENTYERYEYLDDQTFTMFGIQSNYFNIYDVVQIHYKRNDNNYIIHSIYGKKLYEFNIDECYKEFDNILEEISSLFRNTEKVGPQFSNHPADVSGKSKVWAAYLWFENGDYVAIECYDWSEKVEYMNNLKVGLAFKEVSDWLNQN